jgi:putative membrane protein
MAKKITKITPIDRDEPRTLRDILAIDRTILANRRTLLSFVRTGLYFILTGLAILNLDFMQDYYLISFIFFSLGPLVLIWGILTYFRVHRRVLNGYRRKDEPETGNTGYAP